MLDATRAARLTGHVYPRGGLCIQAAFGLLATTSAQRLRMPKADGLPYRKGQGG